MPPKPAMDREDKLIGALWDEWNACPAGSAPEAEAECAGLLAGLLPASFEIGAEGSDGLPLRIRRPRVARRLLKLWRGTSWSSDWNWNIADVLDLPSDRKGGGMSLFLPKFLWEPVALFLKGRGPSGDLSGKHWAWLRGLWGGCGSLYLPRSGPYLTLRVNAPPVAGRLLRLLKGTGAPWNARLFRGARETSLRDHENIVTFLCNLGLTDAALKLEERAILRAMKEQANRARNCDTANAHRIVRAAEEQAKLASRISREGLLPSLAPALRQLVEARLANLDAPLSELGAKLAPPVTKSTVRYRWTQIEKIVEANLHN